MTTFQPGDMTDPRAFLADVIAKADAATPGPWTTERIWHTPTNMADGHHCWDVIDAGRYGQSPEQFIRCIREDELDAEDAATFIAQSRTTSPAMARALLAVLDECDQLRFKGKGEPDDMPDEDDMIADRIATRIHQAITTNLAKEEA